MHFLIMCNNMHPNEVFVKLSPISDPHDITKLKKSYWSAVDLQCLVVSGVQQNKIVIL